MMVRTNGLNYLLGSSSMPNLLPSAPASCSEYTLPLMVGVSCRLLVGLYLDNKLPSEGTLSFGDATGVIAECNVADGTYTLG